jgi:hypothetical protein
MAAVVDIIQSVMPSACSDGEDIEIPVDELDTYTLRQLQDFVQNALTAKSKKRSVPPSPSGGRTTTPRSNPSKKSRTSSAPPPPAAIPAIPPPPAIPAPPPSPPSQATVPSATPTFFSSQSYVPPSDPPDPPAGRKRSNSLELFPADENNVAADSSIENSDAWKSVAEQSEAKETFERQKSGDWGDALYEKHDSESRRQTLQAEVGT